MAPNTTFGGSWTEEKLACLAKYLHACTTIFRRNPRARFFTTYYVDAFAGTGKILRSLRDPMQKPLFPEIEHSDAQGYLKGSAARALEVQPGFDRYLFVEADPERCQGLEALKQKYPDRSGVIEVVASDANTYLPIWCKKTDWRRTRAVVLLDPFGMQVTWPLLEGLARTAAIDLWLLFPLGSAVNRLLTRNKPPDEPWARRITEILGTTAWREAFYHKTKLQTLFGEEAQEHREADFEAVGAFFLSRLSEIFAQVADKPLVLRNSRNIPLFLFCFASGNKKAARVAVKIAQDIIGR